MKKILFTSVLLLFTLVMGAQTIKVSPKMEKGTKKTYVAEVVTNLLGMSEIKANTETDYIVTDVKPDGFVMECVLTKFDSDAKKDDVMSRVFSITQEMIKGITVRFETDKDGKPLRILNFEELKKGMEAVVDKLLTEVLSQAPEAAALSKDDLKQQVLSSMTEDVLLQSMSVNTSPIALNGKTISLGLQDEYLNSNGLKMKRTYIPSANGTITTTGVLSMTKDDMKQLVMKTAKERGGDMVDDTMIENILNSGMVKFEANEKAVYTLDTDGWVKSIKADVSSETMGMKTTVNSTITLKK